MTNSLLDDEKSLLQKIAAGSEVAFEKLFKHYYSPLAGYAFSLLKDSDLAAETSQEVFVKFWEKRAEIEIELSVKSYLFRAVFNRCMNLKKHEEVKQLYQKSEAGYNSYVHEDSVTNWELKEQLHNAIASLPEQCRRVFTLAKLEGKKYREIAEELNISEKTVENHMGKALKDLRVYLEAFVIFVLSILIFWND